MASTALGLHAPDAIKRRVMFALELVDPVTGRLASEGMVITAPGLAPPVLSPSGRFVWIDIDPPAKRAVKIKAESKRRIFAPLEEEFEVPARGPGIGAGDLLKRFNLVPTGLYEPPPGALAVAGTLIDTTADRNGLPGVSVNLCLHGQTDPIASDYVATTDKRGQFVAVMMPAPDASGPLAPPPPDSAARLVGWLAFTTPGSQTRYTPLLVLRKGRLLRHAEPLAWDDLLQHAPQAPP
jgi:hypothetical protein